MVYIKFLGTCGGRFATIFQTRSTGGIFFAEDNVRLSIDPGPGALVRMHQELIDPTTLDAVLVSHCHIDHSNDAAIIVEAMTRGSTIRRGILIGSTSVTIGYRNSPPVVPRYQTGKLDMVATARPGSTFTVGHLEITATPASHTDSTTVGFTISTKHGEVGYVSDSSYFDEMPEIYNGCRLLIICTTRPLNARIDNHMCTEDAAELISRAKPEIAVLTHFGLKTLRVNPINQAQWVTNKTGIRTIAAMDSMVIRVEKEIYVSKP